MTADIVKGPAAMQTSPGIPDPDEIRTLVSGFLPLEGPLLPMLHALQDHYRHIPPAAVDVLADVLNRGKAEIHGVISFYSDFRYQPPGRHVLRICRAEACQANGGEALANRTLRELGVDWGGTTADGKITVEPVYCLGLCACSPAAMLDDRLIGRLDEKAMDRLTRETRE